MVIKVSGVLKSGFYNEQKERKTKFYFPQTPKIKVKNDFKIMLDTEIKKLHFDKII